MAGIFGVETYLKTDGDATWTHKCSGMVVEVRRTKVMVPNTNLIEAAVRVRPCSRGPSCGVEGRRPRRATSPRRRWTSHPDGQPPRHAWSPPPRWAESERQGQGEELRDKIGKRGWCKDGYIAQISSTRLRMKILEKSMHLSKPRTARDFDAWSALIWADLNRFTIFQILPIYPSISKTCDPAPPWCT